MRVDTRGLAHAPEVDLERFSGKWYVIANIPYWAEKDKVGTYVEYVQREDGMLDDFYYFQPDNFASKQDRWEGVAWVMDDGSNAIWKTQFVWPLKVDYVILEVDADYQTALVGHPERKLAWLFSREARMDQARYDELLGTLSAQGFDASQVRRVPQRREDLGQPGFQ